MAGKTFGSEPDNVRPGQAGTEGSAGGRPQRSPRPSGRRPPARGAGDVTPGSQGADAARGGTAGDLEGPNAGKGGATDGPDGATADRGSATARPDAGTAAPAATAAAGAAGTRRTVAAVVWLEAAGLLGLAVFLVIEAFAGTPVERGGAFVLALMTLLTGGGLALVARGVSTVQRWARAPVLTWQVLQAAVAFPALKTRWYLAVPLLIASLIAGSGVLRPGVLPTEREPPRGA